MECGAPYVLTSSLPGVRRTAKWLAGVRATRELSIPFSRKRESAPLLSSLLTGIFLHRINAVIRETVTDDPIHYRSVRCDGSESSITQCPSSDITGSCIHNYDAAVTCRSYPDSQSITDPYAREHLSERSLSLLQVVPPQEMSGC